MTIYMVLFMVMLMTYNRCECTEKGIAMHTANIAELKARLSEFVSLAEKGEEVRICRRNVPVARIVPEKPPAGEGTKIGCGVGTVEFLGDVVSPPIPLDEYDAMKD